MNTLIWFQKNLRVADNPSLINACKGADKVVAVYCFDPREYEAGSFGFKRTGKFRTRFLLESVAALRKNLSVLNISLLIYHEKARDIIPDLIKKHEVSTVFSQKEWTPNERKTIEEVKAACPEQVNFSTTYGQFLYHPFDIPYPDLNNIPKVFTVFREKIEKQANVHPTMNTPHPLPAENRIDQTTSLPSLQDLGFENFDIDKRSAYPFHGGEPEALKRLKYYFWETKNLTQYKATRNDLIGTDYSSKLSGWLANGCISPRTIYWEVKKFEEQEEKNESTYWLIFELIWRDFFKYVSLQHGDDFFSLQGINSKTYDWNENPEILDKWVRGETEYTFVNANMIEIATTGYMSNRGRQVVASYWSRELKQDWRIGAAYFQSMLIDYDIHNNWGNWLYNSGVGNDPRNRKFDVKEHADFYDSTGEYQRLWTQKNLF